MQFSAVRVRTDDMSDATTEAPAGAGRASANAPAAAQAMTVLLIVPTLDAGAAASNVRDIVDILTRAGHRAVVVARDGREAGVADGSGAGWISLDVATVNPAVMLANVPRLVRIVRERGCQIVHAHGRAGAWSAYLATRIAGRPLVTTWYKGFREQNLLKRAYNGVMARGERVVAVSEQMAELVRERYRTAPERLRVVPISIDTMHFDPAAVTPQRIEAVRREWGFAARTRVLLVAGRMLRRKGHHVVVEAARRLKSLGLKDFVCLFASQDAGTRYAGELWDLVLATDTSDVVRLAGPLGDMSAAYAAATVVVSPAVQQEGVQRVMLEAQAMARPVIVSDLGAGADLVLAPPSVPEDRMTGLRFSAGDAAALAAAVVRLLSMPDAERAAMGVRGRAWVGGNFDSATVAAQTLDLYSGALRAPRAP
jgi:glycosyltransferase involved in cell wall biosynthesis